MALINKLKDIGDSIREKTNKTDLFTLEDMAQEIRAMEIATPMSYAEEVEF